jgi:hypothetical protein
MYELVFNRYRIALVAYHAWKRKQLVSQRAICHVRNTLTKFRKNSLTAEVDRTKRLDSYGKEILSLGRVDIFCLLESFAAVSATATSLFAVRVA